MAILRRAILLVLVTLFAASAARAQVEPPPATSPPPGAAPAAPADAPAPPPPPAATAPIAPLSPTLAPEQAPAPALELSQRSAYTPSPEPVPFYRKTWFWVTVGAVVATVAIILLATLGEDDNGPPATTFGNMHAF